MASVEDEQLSLSDVDAALWKWAEVQLGPGYTVDDLDTSKVKVTQKAVIYQGESDWFVNKYRHEEIFTNEENIPTTWNYCESVDFSTNVTWKIAEIFKSSILPSFNARIEFPCRTEGLRPISIEVTIPRHDERDMTVTLDENYPINEQLTIGPYCAMEARVKMKTCHLRDTPFSCDVTMSGPIKVRGHKKRKNKSKIEVTSDIESALKSVPGFSSYTGPGGGGFCTVHGTCTGEVPAQVCADIRDLQSLV